MTHPQDPAGPLPRPLPPHLDPRGGRRSAAREVHGSARVRTSGRTSRSAWGRALSFLAVLTSFSVLALSVAGYALVHHYDDQVTRVQNVFDIPDRPAETPRDARNVLIVGSDSRGDLAAGEGVQGKGATYVSGQRSDTMILAHLYGDTDEAQLISFPRDSWVTIPAYTSPETGELVAEHEGKLNSAFFDGGPALLIQTIEDLSGLRVDNYLQIDFDGFQKMVNTLGGVEVCLSQPAREKDSGIDLPAGRQVVKGDQALAFVRQRKGLPGGDLGRIARQQQFIGAIVRKTLSAGTLLNPFKLNSVISVAASSVQVDDGTSIDDLRELATRFRGFDAGGVAFTTVPVADGDAWRERQSVVLLDPTASEQLFDRVRRDVPPDRPDPTPPTPATEKLVVAPSAIRVRVFNGAGVQGLGRQAHDDLAAVGFSLIGSPANRGTKARQTTVYHGPDRADSARTVAAAIPGARTELDPSLGRTIDVVVGSSYTGAKAVRVQGQPAPKPSASSSPAIRTAAEDPCAP